MQQLRLGASGLQVSRVCLGMMSFGNDSERAWVIDEAAAEPIVGATKPGHLHDALAAESLSLSSEEIARLEELYVPHPIRGH